MVLWALIGGLFISMPSHSTIVGSPPLTEIDIPPEPYVTVFDMVQDANNVIYLSYDKGLKIYDGNRWHSLIIPNTYLTRVLYFDQQDRVYVGGYNFFGYVTRNDLGAYVFVNLTPQNNPIKFASMWDIIGCNELLYFKALNHVFQYAPQSGNISSWTFTGKLGDIECHNGQVLLQDRSEGMKVLNQGVWVDSVIQLVDNSLIYDFEVLDNEQIFIRSQTDNWRVIENNQIKPIEFDAQLPELGGFVSSLTLANNQIVLGGNDGALTFLDFNDFTADSFQLSNDWISKIIQANDGGLLILSNFTIYHLTWPSPWRIQDSATGLSSDIFDLAMWNNGLYAASRAGIFIEDSQQEAKHLMNFKNLNWTNQEAWSLLPLNDQEMLFAESHHAYLVTKGQEKQQITDIIYPRVFQPSRFNPNHILLLTEFDTRFLARPNDQWENWVIATGKPSSVVELSSDTLLITTIEGRFFKVVLNQQLDAVEATVEMHNQAGVSAEEISKLKLYSGPENTILGQGNNNYYQFIDNQLTISDLHGLSNLVKPKDLFQMGITPTGQLWAASSTQVHILNENNTWQTIDASEHMKSGIFDVEFLADQIKISGNGVILSYLYNQDDASSLVSGKMMITAASLAPNDGSQPVEFPVVGSTPFTMAADVGGLTIQYSFTDIKNQDATTYQYRLLGHNNQWSPYSRNTQASFLELPAGDYAFEVTAKDINGQIHTSPKLSFNIEPHWYLTPLAKFLWLLSGLAFILLLFKLFLMWREKKHEEQKQALKVIINEKTHALKLANQALQDLAHKDSLTGLSNRLYLDKYINELIENRIARVAIIMMDMDHFKKYNDTFGHLAGDQLLEKFAKSLMTRIKRKQDLTARYGGEEFLVIMPNTDEEYTLRAAENIRSHTERQEEKTTISLGVAFSNEEQTIKSAKDIFYLIDQADKALYEAKTTGRNQVVVYSEALEETS